MELENILPQPILPAHPDWIALYWKAWELSVENIAHGTPQNGFAETYLDDAFSENIFQWDTCFIVQYARYGWHCLPVLQALDNFYNKQDSDGYICREYRGTNGAALWSKGSADATNPPLFAWAEWNYYQISNDRNRLREVLPSLVAHYHWLATHQLNNKGLYWSTTWGCGMDNIPRYGASWVDFSSQQALNALYIARIAQAVGEDHLASDFHSDHFSLRERVNTMMWDNEAGYYWDLDANSSPIPSKTVAPFWTLLAEVTPTDRVRRLAGHLSNPEEFWRPHVFPSLSVDDPNYSPEGNYWRGSVWPITNYAIIKGLSVNAQHSLARKASVNHLEQMTIVYRETGTIWENYSPEYKRPGSRSKPNFVGFSGISPIALLIEEILGIEVDAPNGVIHWRLFPTTKQGLCNLRLGDSKVDLLAQAERDGEIVIQVKTVQPFTLQVEGAGVKKVLSIPVGGYRFMIKDYNWNSELSQI